MGPLTPEWLDFVDEIKGEVHHEKEPNFHDKKWLDDMKIKYSRKVATKYDLSVLTEEEQKDYLDLKNKEQRKQLWVGSSLWNRLYEYKRRMTPPPRPWVTTRGYNLSLLSDKERKDYLQLKDKQNQQHSLRRSELTRWNEYRNRIKKPGVIPDPDPNIETIDGREVIDADADFPDHEYSVDPRVPKGVYASKTAVQTEDGVNSSCPACHGQNVMKLDSSQEDGSLVQCLGCGCFFAV